MQKAGHFEAERTRPQFVVAVFDDWDALHAVLVGLKSHTTLRSGVVLHARKDAPPPASSFGLLKEMAHLRFSQPRQDIACTAGPLAQELSIRSAGGARSLAGALHGWFGSDQAEQLQSHIGRGHLLLCLQLGTPEDFSVVCGRLVQASPHMVGLCNIKFGS